MIHYLKVWPTYYERLADGTKTFAPGNPNPFSETVVSPLDRS